MDNYTSNKRRLSLNSNSLTTATSTLPLLPVPEHNEIDGGEQSFQEGGDPAVWEVFTENFRRVQTVLDRNRVLIQRVNENHQSKIHENIVKNVGLIQEINGNISKVVSLYSELSANFSSAVVHQTSATAGKSNSPAAKEKQ
ncbi:hypothetical protein ACP275_06G138100 [Erythranthe tilingii]